MKKKQTEIKKKQTIISVKFEFNFEMKLSLCLQLLYLSILNFSLLQTACSHKANAALKVTSQSSFV